MFYIAQNIWFDTSDYFIQYALYTKLSFPLFTPTSSFRVIAQGEHSITPSRVSLVLVPHCIISLLLYSNTPVPDTISGIPGLEGLFPDQITQLFLEA